METIYKNVEVGRPRAFNSPNELWSSAVKYFEWCESNPIKESKVFNNQGDIVKANVSHIRAMTQAGLCIHLNIGVSTWHDYKNKPQYSEVTSIIENIMYEQKFSGAAAGMLNSNIIARDLGLADKQETTTVELTHDEWMQSLE